MVFKTIDIDNLIQNEREVKSSYHLTAGQAWRRKGENSKLHSPLIYAAFEFRLAIERCVFEFYYLMVKEELIDPETIPTSELKRTNSFTSLVQVILEKAENRKKLFLALTFNQFFDTIILRRNSKISHPNLSKMQKYWHKLSEYCHKQLKPEETWNSANWIDDGYRLLNEVENYLWELIVERGFGWIEIKSLDHRLMDERNRFLNEEIDSGQLQRRLQLIEPLLAAEENIKNILRKF